MVWGPLNCVLDEILPDSMRGTGTGTSTGTGTPSSGQSPVGVLFLKTRKAIDQ